MTSFWIKLFITPIGVALSAWLFTGLEFGAWYQPVILGLILAGVGLMLEYLFLKRGTLWLSTGLDFIVSVLLVFFLTPFFSGAAVTFTAALLTGLLLTFVEYFTHSYLIRSGKTRKA